MKRLKFVETALISAAWPNARNYVPSEDPGIYICSAACDSEQTSRLLSRSKGLKARHALKRANGWPGSPAKNHLLPMWPWVKPMGSHFGVGAPPILEPISVVGLGCSLGVHDFDPWPCGAALQNQALQRSCHATPPPPRVSDNTSASISRKHFGKTCYISHDQ